MYLDNTFFIKEDPFVSHYKFSRLGKSIPVHESTFMSFNTEDRKLNQHCLEIIHSNHSFFDEVLDVIYNYSDHKVVYTKLDLNQSYSQVLRNKYFKSFIGKRQLIIKEYEMGYED